MTELTKEYFEQNIKELATSDAVAKIDGKVERFAIMVKKSFDDTDHRLGTIVELLDVRGELKELKLEFSEIKGKLEQALNVKL